MLFSDFNLKIYSAIFFKIMYIFLCFIYLLVYFILKLHVIVNIINYYLDIIILKNFKYLLSKNIKKNNKKNKKQYLYTLNGLIFLLVLILFLFMYYIYYYFFISWNFSFAVYDLKMGVKDYFYFGLLINFIVCFFYSFLNDLFIIKQFIVILVFLLLLKILILLIYFAIKRFVYSDLINNKSIIYTHYQHFLVYFLCDKSIEDYKKDFIKLVFYCVNEIIARFSVIYFFCIINLFYVLKMVFQI